MGAIDGSTVPTDAKVSIAPSWSPNADTWRPTVEAQIQRNNDVGWDLVTVRSETEALISDLYLDLREDYDARHAMWRVRAPDQKAIRDIEGDIASEQEMVRRLEESAKFSVCVTDSLATFVGFFAKPFMLFGKFIGDLR